MSKHKKQHYVPQFYLRNFSDSSFFNMFFIEQNLVRKNIPIKGQCQLHNYYDREENKDWEIELSKMESKWASVFRNIINNADNSLDQNIELSLIQFSIVQHLRSTTARDSYINRSWSLVRIMYEMEHENSSEKDIENLRTIFLKDHDHIPANLLDMTNTLFPLVNDLAVKVINYQCDEKLISSDNPILVSNRIYRSVGFANAGLILVFPISPEHLVVIYDKNIYKNTVNYSISNNKNEVRQLNKLQVINANNNVFGLDEYFFKNTNIMLNSTINQRKTHWESILNINTLGTKSQKLSLFENRRLPMNVFSFSRLTKLGNKLKNINCIESDWFPRKISYMPEYNERVKSKLQFAKSSVSLTNNGNPTFNLNEVQKFNNLVKEYWSKVDHND